VQQAAGRHDGSDGQRRTDSIEGAAGDEQRGQLGRVVDAAGEADQGSRGDVGAIAGPGQGEAYHHA
jgi:hypothetical protein